MFTFQTKYLRFSRFVSIKFLEKSSNYIHGIRMRASLNFIFLTYQNMLVSWALSETNHKFDAYSIESKQGKYDHYNRSIFKFVTYKYFGLLHFNLFMDSFASSKNNL